MGHVPQDPAGAEGASAELQRPQHRRTSRQQHLARANQARARLAEDLVAAWYQRNGYEVIARNWRCARGELDVVAWRDGVLVVCEVKARRNGELGDAFESITPRKVLRIRRATAMFIAASRSDVSVPQFSEVRFDAAAIRGRAVEFRHGVF